MKMLVLAFFGLLSVEALAAEDATALCVLCHGSDANGNIGVRAPKLAGMERSYLERQLQSFRSGLRGTHALDIGGGEMRTVVLSLSDAEVAKTLDFIARAKSESPAVTVEGDAVRGRTLYESCAVCHGARGEGNQAAQAPKLAGGSDWYFVMQLNNYRNGIRGATPGDTIGATMRAAATILPDDTAVQDVVAYLNTLR